MHLLWERDFAINSVSAVLMSHNEVSLLANVL